MTAMICLSHHLWMMTTSPHLEGKVASSVEGKACLTTTRYIKLMIFLLSSVHYHLTETVDCSQNLIFAVKCFAFQGDLFSEAPKPSVSEEKKSVNENVKSTAQAAGKTHLYKMI